MNYLSYPKKKETPSRLARKQARRGIYWKNYKMKSLQKKAKHLARQVEQGE